MFRFLCFLFVFISTCHAYSAYNVENCISSYPIEIQMYPTTCNVSFATERLALISFYHSMGGNHWYLQGNWLNESTSICRWGGVGCDTDCHVTTISLQRNNLTGIFPQEMQHLSKLNNLYLMCNQIHGGLYSLVGLPIKQLNLRSNALNGTVIDPNLFPMVFNFVLSYNELTGTLPPLIKISTLGNLELCYNQLKGSIPSVITDYPTLNIYLENNLFNGTIPSFNHLTWLDLSWNQLSGTIPVSLFDNMSLKYLGLNNNFLTGEIPNRIQSCPLHNIFLQNNQLTGNFQWDLKIPGTYLWIDISHNQLTGTISLPYKIVSFLDLSYNQFSGDVRNIYVAYSINIEGNVNMKTSPLEKWIPIDAYSYHDGMLCNYVRSVGNNPMDYTLLFSDPSYYNYTYCRLA